MSLSNRRVFKGDLLGGRVGDVALVALALAAVAIVAFWIGPLQRSDALSLESVDLALAFGILSSRSGSEHRRQLAAVVEKASAHERGLSRVSSALKTEALDPRADFLHEISKLLAVATKSVRILCDFPAYRVFSSGEHFDEYLRLLRGNIAKCTGVPATMTVELMYLAAAERLEMTRHQTYADAPTENDWSRWIASQTASEPGTTGRLEAFWERSAMICGSNDPELPSGLTPEGFAQRLVAVDTAVAPMFIGARIVELTFSGSDNGETAAVRNGPDLYLWIVDEDDPDNAQAIFVLVPLSAGHGKRREHAFKTTDQSLIRSLVGIYDRYRDHVGGLHNRAHPDRAR